MTKSKEPEVKTSLVTPDAHLKQLAALKAEGEDSLGTFRSLVRKSLLSIHSLKALRVMHIRELAFTGYSREQIKLAFVADDSPLNPLVDGLQSEAGAKTFQEEVKAALVEYDNLDAKTYHKIYVHGQERLIAALWSLLGRGSGDRATIELLVKLQQNVAESYGTWQQPPGHRGTARPPAPTAPAPAPAEDVTKASTPVDPN